jgi:twitching motility protein PilT
MPLDQSDRLLGHIALHYKLVTREQLTQAVGVQGRSIEPKRLGEVMVELGMLSPQHLQQLLQVQHKMQAEERARQQTAQAESPAAASPVPAAQPSNQPPSEASPAAGSHAIDRILAWAVQVKASDVHIHSGLPVQVRIAGNLLKAKSPPLSAAEVEAMVMEILTPQERQRFKQENDVDFAYVAPGVARFRGNVYRQRTGVDAVFRPIPLTPPTLASLNLPNTLAKLTTFHQGLVLVTGPAGCGKSATLAALIDLINEDRCDHIITVEDPVEFVHKSKRCVVNQRQVVRHTATFASALRAALREDPDVIAIGELRDLETISLAITAAETGHLVLGTLHTNNAARTINRILDAFPPTQQSQIRAMISESLRAIVSQRLVPTVDGSSRVPALEILLVNTAISNLIREERVFQLKSAMTTGRSLGMCQLDDSLLELVKAGTVSKETARRFAEDPKPFV